MRENYIHSWKSQRDFQTGSKDESQNMNSLKIKTL